MRGPAGFTLEFLCGGSLEKKAAHTVFSFEEAARLVESLALADGLRPSEGDRASRSLSGQHPAAQVNRLR